MNFTRETNNACNFLQIFSSLLLFWEFDQNKKQTTEAQYIIFTFVAVIYDIEGNCKVFIDEMMYILYYILHLHLVALGWHQLKDKNIVCQ